MTEGILTHQPLCVDLDGTLIRTDLLFESLMALIRQSPVSILLIPFWLLSGRAVLKRRIAERVKLDTSTLPYNEPFVDFLRAQRESGRRLVLATASDKILANRVGEHLGIFDDVIGSDGLTNLKGMTKAVLLEKRYGEKGFAYAGNSFSDFPVWEKCSDAVVVCAPKRVIAKAGAKFSVTNVFGEANSMVALLRALRVRQWVKNLLVFVPFVMAHQIGNAALLAKTMLCFIAFCAIASGVYVLNDLLDLEADRAHPLKRFRPFASGEGSLAAGIVLAPALIAFGLWLSHYLSLASSIIVALYFIITSYYSLRGKQIPVLDIVILASLYTIRLLGGGVAADIVVSQWLLAFSMFMFLSLACVKRFSELLSVQQRNEHSLRGRGYHVEDLEQIAIFGSAAAYISVMLMALYVSSDEVTALYAHPNVLWLICPPLLYWVSRIWLLARRGVLHEDPVVFAIEDKVSYAVGLICLLIMWLAI